MRIVLISGIVFVHIPFDAASSPYNGTYEVFDWLRVFLGEALFRVGVPCLSAISGYLLFRGGRETFCYAKTVRNKVRTVLLPFLLWNGAFFLLVLLFQRAGIGDGYFHDLWNAPPKEVLDQLAGAQDVPVNLPLYFLRDLFVCILLSPVLAWLIERIPILTLSVLAVAAVVPDLAIWVVQRNSILFSFSFGIYISLYGLDLKALDRYAPVGFAGVLGGSALLATAIYLNGPNTPYWVQFGRNLLAIGGAAGCWMASSRLIETSVGKRLARTGSLSFWIFCAHYPLLMLLWITWGKTGVAFYPAFYFLALAVAFPALILSNASVRNRLPRLYGILTGSRSKATPQTAGTSRPAKLLSQQR
jgi:succinoglycan biosynthesis protein ExoH